MLCFKIFPVANKFMDKRFGEYQDFPPNIFCLTVPKNAVGEPFCPCLILGIERLDKRGEEEEEGTITIFCRKLFVSQCRKFLWGNLLCCVSEKIRQRKNFWIRRGVSRFSVEIILSNFAETFRR